MKPQSIACPEHGLKNIKWMRVEKDTVEVWCGACDPNYRPLQHIEIKEERPSRYIFGGK